MFLAVGRVNSERSKLTNGEGQKGGDHSLGGGRQSGGTWRGVDMGSRERGSFRRRGEIMEKSRRGRREMGWGRQRQMG